MFNVLSEIGKDLRSSRLLPAVSIGAVLGILLVIIEVSFAAMIYSDALAPLALRAAGVILFGTLLTCLITALGTTFKPSIMLPQDAPAAILSTAGVAVAASFGMEASEDVRFMTMLAVMGSSAILTGGLFITIGHFKLANLFRFMPYPVVGGFLAGTGWLLASGSIGVMCDVPLTLSTLDQLINPAVMAKWLPGVLYGITLFMILNRWSHFLILPSALVLGMGLFYVGFLAYGISPTQAAQQGFLLSGLPEGGLWPAFSFTDISHINWSVVLTQIPTILTVALVSILGLLMNVSGMELASGQEVDLNQEYVTGGIGNTLAGFSGCFPGYSALSLSTLGLKTGANTRLTGLITGATLAATLFLGSSVLSYFPKPLLGGLLLLLGLFFIVDWIFASRKRLSTTDYGLVLAIFAMVAFVGFLEGVAFGLFATILFFVFRFSRISAIRESFDISTRTSLKKRPIPHQKILRAMAEQVRGHELTGYIFFGSASALVDQLKENLPGDQDNHGYLLLDFTSVSGFDISAVNNFYRLIQTAELNSTTVVLTASPVELVAWLSKHIPSGSSHALKTLPNLDEGLEWCEDHLLQRVQKELKQSQTHQTELFDSSVDDMIIQLKRQERFEALTQELTPWGNEQQFETGDQLTVQGEAVDGMLLITWGEATEEVDSIRLNSLRPGSVVSAQAAFEEHIAESTVTADSSVTAIRITRSDCERLEKENPTLTIQLNRFLITNTQ